MVKNFVKTGSMKADAFGKRQTIIALAILAVSVVCMVMLVKFRTKPQRKVVESLAPLVKVERLKARDIQMVIRGSGTVRPKVEVEIVSQVSGKIVRVNRQFSPGGRISANETIIEIDPRDYELAEQQAQAGVAEAQVRLDIEKSEGQVAREEWEEINPDKEPVSELVFRGPQIRGAETRIESAKATLAKARLDLERTKISLPVDVRITSESVDLGQYVMVGKTLGAAYGVEAVKIELPLENGDLAWFEIYDGQREKDELTQAEVKADFAGAMHSWAGYVIGTTGQVDRKSRLISVVIEVPDPCETNGSKMTLLPGMFVEVLIKGNVLKNAIAIPRDAVHNGNEIWIVKDGKLQIEPVKIVRSDKEFAYIAASAGEELVIITSSLDIASDGMKVRASEGDNAADGGEQK